MLLGGGLRSASAFVVNNVGPKTLPCGTPFVNFLVSNLLCETTTVTSLFCK